MMWILTTFSGGKDDLLPFCQFLFVTTTPITRCIMLNFEQVNSLFVYKDGFLYKKLKTGILSSKKSGTKTHNGYEKIQIANKSYLAHRIIYLLHNKTLPEFIDHIDGNPLNNTIENLRACTKSQNIMNCTKRKSNISGHKGVSYCSNQKKWRVEVQENKIRHCLGNFDDFELACLVADEGRNLYHMEFAKND